MDQASNLRAQMQRQDGYSSPMRVIAVTSGKGGVGKTSFSVNLAIQLEKMGKRVLIFDADFGLSNVEVMLGIRPQYNISDLIYKQKNISDIITEGPMNIGFISGGSGVQDLGNLDSKQVKLLISKMSQLDSMYDNIIIDTGAGISDAVLEFVLTCPEIMLVVTPEPTSITDAYSLLKAVNRKKEFIATQKTIHVVSNKVESESEGMEIYQKLNAVASKFLNIQLEYIGYIYQDRNISKAVIAQNPITITEPKGETARLISGIADRIVNDKKYEEQQGQGIAGVFLNYIKTRRRNK